MIIKILNYRLESNCYGNYDLVEEAKATKKDGTSYIKKSTIAHGISLEKAIKRIINNNLHNNPVTLDLEQFLVELKNEHDKINKLFELQFLKA